MNRLNILIKTCLTLLGTGFFAVIIFVSILGENDKTDDLVTRFFDALKNRNYDAVCTILSQKNNGYVFGDDRSCMDTCFLLELAFLTHYQLLDNSDYTVDVHRDPFWIPFVTDDKISISIAFTSKKNTVIEKLLRTMDDEDFIRDFITVSRKNGSWVIESVNLMSSSLYPQYMDLASKVNLNRFITKTDRGFQLNQNTIDPDSLSPLDRRVLDFSLNKLTN